eukprot:4645059-Pleurochrysis_carterae.AAC.1
MRDLKLCERAASRARIVDAVGLHIVRVVHRSAAAAAVRGTIRAKIRPFFRALLRQIPLSLGQERRAVLIDQLGPAQLTVTASRLAAYSSSESAISSILRKVRFEVSPAAADCLAQHCSLTIHSLRRTACASRWASIPAISSISRQSCDSSGERSVSVMHASTKRKTST